MGRVAELVSLAAQLLWLPVVNCARVVSRRCVATATVVAETVWWLQVVNHNQASLPRTVWSRGGVILPGDGREHNDCHDNIMVMLH